MGRVDIITGTLGKALGRSHGRLYYRQKEIIEILRQRSRPYLFSNSLAPAINGNQHSCFYMLSETTALRDKLERNVNYLRKRNKIDVGWRQRHRTVMLYDAKSFAVCRQTIAGRNLRDRVLYPVVAASDKARIRVRLSTPRKGKHLIKRLPLSAKWAKSWE